ncbi:MAG: hypothetical protein KJZ54_02445 [Phycisphaerales bacterium]|nr:hypothetical protein [Phycisphaerales bacterium]
MRKRVLLTLFLAAPILVVAGLLYAVAVSLERGVRLAAPPVGAGAGQTGGANALGEYLAGRTRLVPAESLPGGVAIVLHDASGQSSESRPVFIVIDDAEPLRMARRADGAWVALLEQRTVPGRAALRFVLGEEHAPEIDGDGREVGPRRLPMTDPAARPPGAEPPTIEFTAAGFGPRPQD